MYMILCYVCILSVLCVWVCVCVSYVCVLYRDMGMYCEYDVMLYVGVQCVCYMYVCSWSVYDEYVRMSVYTISYWSGEE